MNEAIYEQVRVYAREKNSLSISSATALILDNYFKAAAHTKTLRAQLERL